MLNRFSISQKILAYSVMITLLLCIGGALAFTSLSRTQTDWRTHQARIIEQQKQLLALHRAFGPAAQSQTETMARLAHQTLSAYQKLAGLSAAEKSSVGLLAELADKLGEPAIATQSEQALQSLSEQFTKRVAADHGAITSSLSGVSTLLLWILLPALLMSLAFAFVTRAFVLAKAARITETLELLTHGDLTRRIAVPETPDELDQLAMGVNRMSDSLVKMIRNVSLRSATLDAVINESQGVKDLLNKDAKQAHERTYEAVARNSGVDEDFTDLKNHIDKVSTNFTTVYDAALSLTERISAIADASASAEENVSSAARSTQEMAANINEINQDLDSVNASMQEVASKIGDINQSIQEVNERCVTANAESQRTKVQSQESMERMTKLADSAHSIEAVVEIINDIAEQTNMLALNAAIEAAGAGDAGKGFAVVANEVKELARQTTESTLLIRERIDEIQDGARDAANASKHVSESIEQIAAINNEINTLVGEQNHTIGVISHSMQEVSQAALRVSGNAQEISESAGAITAASQSADASVREITAMSAQASSDAASLTELGQQSQQLAEEAKTMGTNIFSASCEVQKNGIQTMNLVNMMNGSIHQTEMLVEVIQETSTALLQSTEGLRIGNPTFDVRAIKLAHLGWLTKLEHVIRGRVSLSPNEVATGRDCAFGKWYYSSGVELFGDLPVFQHLGEVHLKVHETAREVVHLAHEQKTEEAIVKMSDFNNLRRQLFELLDEVFQDCKAIAIVNPDQQSNP
ncbi:methyl-accepting chemotaxis protein [Magnetofaba australis]|uniref:Putative methyl-accepting chemotaxis sensory transducer n=1 Tax=Magnetofaba australis IT-1 TaxID=1434232 RepID=A0A1Y2K5Z6_9PROT|nr:methyl-accepting chemotaxis protein [Magnetofaba australis]OSM04953.1 putative methyl-accepting chemotaxis sensory transducer [Magnetofaba australis IT-1]